MRPHGDWMLFNSTVQSNLADLLYCRAELSVSNIDHLLEVWAKLNTAFGTPGPFQSHKEMHTLIDSSKLGDNQWQCLEMTFPGPVNEGAPEWMHITYEVWHHDPDAIISTMLDNPSFDGQFDLCPHINLDANETCWWSEVMSGNIAWWCSVSKVLYIF
jgi:hypothetical protein